MTDPRSGSSRHADSELPQVRDDLRALGDTTARSVPTLDHSVSAVRSRRVTAAQRWKERLMPIADSFTRRPWFATASVVVLAALALLVVPISYQRTVGHDVALTLTGMNNEAQAIDIARELKSVLGAEHVAMKTTAGAANAAMTLEAFVPSRSGIDADARAQVLAKELGARGFTASAVTTARRERVAGNVYAYARDLVIKVDTDGKTAPQIEAEIRQRLAEAGLTNTTVSVTDSGKERKVMVKAENHDPSAAHEGNLELQLTKDGHSLMQGGGFSVELRKMKSPDGLALQITVNDGPKTANVSVPHVDGMSDAAIQSSVESQLKAAGIDDATVKVTNGEVEIGKK